MPHETGAEFCLDVLKQADPERYYTCLFAPAEARPALAALYAFNLEIVRTRELVSEPMIGEIRLQWWRDVLSGKGEGDVASHPVAGPLLKALADYQLPAQTLLNLIDARVFDLYDDPMPSLNDLEAYCGETSSALLQLSLFILSRGEYYSAPDLCGHAGVALGITALLRAFAWHSARGQIYIPQEILHRHKVTIEDLRQRRSTPSILEALAEMRTIARHHLNRAREEIKPLPYGLFPIFLTLTNIEPILRSMEKKESDPFATVIEPSRLGLLFRFWRASKAKMF